MQYSKSHNLLYVPKNHKMRCDISQNLKLALKGETKATVESNIKFRYWNLCIASVCNFIMIFLYRRKFGEGHPVFKLPAQLPINPNAAPKHNTILLFST
ncbi:hypothetical protein BX661DRAFT_184833 [Kickxella alabastrina]|uniref:uncharacterized protein n=1 Tax=Kickxella alabastrina TaxID=61397 RepID=UPI00221EEAEE|nr:uncharacterized protein BX661DRAFT_184833 [Kickxella alabastrina]KAI7825574.1 hypothetical protein BX661DRAFT_184833 [Kickxella alabastrina]